MTVTFPDPQKPGFFGVKWGWYSLPGVWRWMKSDRSLISRGFENSLPVPMGWSFLGGGTISVMVGNPNKISIVTQEITMNIRQLIDFADPVNW
ncbi:hypothetical protein [Limnospira fusiformis]|uniref:hypothetical protein n=1 Tax=Limnospira fusiformis TaxID=54297 RepID=UPI002AA27262|nr:hypothetical protein [Limnospira fusiformis LS22]